MSTPHIWDPVGEMVSLRDAMQQLVEGSVIRPGTWLGGATASQSFPLNVSGTADELKVEALLPGVSPDEVDVNLDRGVLTIAAKRHGPARQERQQWYLQEFQPGQCSRSFTLPFPVDHEQVTAQYTNGVLTLTLPKAEAAKPKRISIETGQAQPQLRSTTQ
jgi:HSP20 family protein